MKRYIEGEGIDGIKRVGFTEGGLEVYLSEDMPENIPHFYVENAKTKKEVRIRMDLPEYLPDGNAGRLTARERDDLIAFLRDKAENTFFGEHARNWQIAVLWWCFSYQDRPFDADMPDYSLLPVEEENKCLSNS